MSVAREHQERVEPHWGPRNDGGAATDGGSTVDRQSRGRHEEAAQMSYEDMDTERGAARRTCR